MKKILSDTGRQGEARQALRQMKQLMTAFRGLLDEELRPRGVTTAQMQLLHQVSAQEGLSGARLARVCSVTPQTMQSLLARTEREGWLRRGKDAENERLVLWSLTKEGRALLREAESAFDRVQARLWAGMSGRAIAEVNEVLARCLKNLQDSE